MLQHLHNYMLYSFLDFITMQSIAAKSSLFSVLSNSISKVSQKSVLATFFTLYQDPNTDPNLNLFLHYTRTLTLSSLKVTHT